MSTSTRIASTRPSMLRMVGVLTALLALTLGAAPAASGAEEDLPVSGRRYIAMADGVELATFVAFPKDWDGQPLPAIFEYDGYNGGSAAAFYPQVLGLGKDYVIVHAGVRGTGCSGGRFELFSDLSAEDGVTLVEWIAAQPWSNGDVGMVGHSYSATMAVYTAAKRPPSLRAITVDGLMDDLYRDLVYPGGVSNSGFPILWLAAARPLQEWDGGTLDASQNDERCREQIASRPPENAWDSPYLHGLAGMEDNDWWYLHSLRSAMGNVEVPVQILGQYQDDQTLARGNVMQYDRVRHENKQLLLTNGDHNSWWMLRHSAVLQARAAWMDHYVRGIDNGADVDDRVRIFLETHRVEGGAAANGELAGDEYPLPGTRWTRYYADGDASLRLTEPEAEGGDVFILGTHRHISDPGAVSSPEGSFPGQEIVTADGPDQIRYRAAPALKASVIAGPIVATLYATVPTGDAELLVRVGVEDPDGNVSWHQRGYLKASHRAIDDDRSWYDGDVLYRPWRPHTNPQLTAVDEPVKLDVEVWPTSFVLRPGDRLTMTVTAPPLQEGFNTFQPRTPPQPLTIHRGPEYPTHLLVPVLDAPSGLGDALGCGQQVAVKCGPPANAQGGSDAEPAPEPAPDPEPEPAPDPESQPSAVEPESDPLPATGGGSALAGLVAMVAVLKRRRVATDEPTR